MWLEISSGDAFIAGTEICGNRAGNLSVEYQSVGGGIWKDGNGSLLMESCKVNYDTCIAYDYSLQYNTTAYSRGGGIYSRGESYLSQCEIDSNFVWSRADGHWSQPNRAYAWGGGIYQASGYLILFKCRIGYNKLEAIGGTISQEGSGVNILEGLLNIENSTISSNYSANSIRRDGGSVSILNSILYLTITTDSNFRRQLRNKQNTVICREDTPDGEILM